MEILISVAVLAAIGAVLGVALAIAGSVFEVKKDERIDKIIKILPRANCGACGFIGCKSYAEAVVNDGVDVNLCAAGGENCVDNIALIMGVNAEKKARMRAQISCSGVSGCAKIKYEYVGLSDCLSVAKLGNGNKECPYACIGLGTCVKSCQFNAIKIEHDIAVVEYEKCKACGICVSSCPQHLINLVPFESDVWIGCSSKDKGSDVRKYCDVGCIGCGICAKVCDSNAITVTENVASIDMDKCTNCGACVEACIRKIIWSGQKQIESGDTIQTGAEGIK